MMIVELTAEVKDLKDEIHDFVEALTKQRMEDLENAKIQDGFDRANRKEDMASLTKDIKEAFTNTFMIGKQSHNGVPPLQHQRTLRQY